MSVKWEVKEIPGCLGPNHAEQGSVCVSRGAGQGPLVGGSKEHTLNFLMVLAASNLAVGLSRTCPLPRSKADSFLLPTVPGLQAVGG